VGLSWLYFAMISPLLSGMILRDGYLMNIRNGEMLFFPSKAKQLAYLALNQIKFSASLLILAFQIRTSLL